MICQGLALNRVLWAGDGERLGAWRQLTEKFEPKTRRRFARQLVSIWSFSHKAAGPTDFPEILPHQIFLQPPCANADDFAVAASSFRSLMTALSPTFEVMDCVAGLNLNHRKCCWVQHDSDSCRELLEWVLTNCPEFREMKIAKFAKYVGTMIGAEGYLHRWTAPWEKFNQRTRKINGTSESLVERLVDFRVYALSVLGYLGSISALGRATLKEEARALHCTTAGPNNAVPTGLLRAGSACGHGIDRCGIRIISLAARFRTAATSGTPVNGPAKHRAARDDDGAAILTTTPEWEEKFLKTSMAYSTTEAYEYVRQMDSADRVADSPSDKKHNAATTLLRDAIQIRDIAVPIVARASRILGPISRHLMEQIIPMICEAARASCPGFAVGILRVLCNGMCKAKRLHVDNEEQTCRVGCPDEPDCLSHYKCPLLSDIFVSIWRNAGVHFREGQLFHDLITQTLLRSLQHGIVVMGVLDTFENAHNYHRHNTNNPGNFEDCMEGRIRLFDGQHSKIRPCVPVPLPSWTPF